MKLPKTLFVPTNAPGVNWWRQVLFFKEMVKYKQDIVMYGYVPNQNDMALFENRYEEDKFGKTIRPQVHQLMRWCEVAIIGFARYPSTISMIEAFRSNLPEVRVNTNGPKKIICDIDDYALDVPPYNPAYKSGWMPGGVYGWVSQAHMRNSDLVINSTEWLAEQHSKYNKNCVVIPNSIDEEWWDVKNAERKGGKIRIGWAGGGNHYEDFRVMSRVIRVLNERYKKDIEWYMVHGAPDYIYKMPNVKLDKRWVCIEKYPKLLASCGFDIGIAPLETNRFNAGKSNLKYLELAVLGIPGVFTDFDPYKSVKQGKTGYKALKTDEWIDCLSKLIESPDLRKNMGLEARKHVLKDFNIKDTTKRYMDLIRGL